MTQIILHLTAGKGPAECRWVLARLARTFAREAEHAGLVCEVLECEEELPASLLLRIDGAGADRFASARTGSILWIGTSPFRPHHKRRNWFVGVARAPLPEEVPDLREADIEYQTMRASGPGGQHVNKTDSAVRARHRPSGLVTSAREQRSQKANRMVARLKLALMLDEQRRANADDARRAQWSAHQDIKRGNPVRTYQGARFSLK